MHLSRRKFLNGVIAASGASVVGVGAPASGARADDAKTAAPSDWPSDADWEALRTRVGGRLIEVKSPLAPCEADTSGAACAATLEDMKNPFYIQDQPGGLQTNGWYQAWTGEISPYAVAAESADDVAVAVNFAREHGVKLVIKGTGHDYLGRSCAPDSLLVWTHNMRDVTYDKAFRITGGPASDSGVPAITAGAGARWLEVYQVASANGRYAQGGGCTTVGAAGGFIQGGGYGSFSKRFGAGAGSVLEFEVVTADGSVLIANAAQNEDLFWALRGGGGGTFGVVTKVTLLTHPMPDTLGLATGTLRAQTDDAFKRLLGRLVAFYPEALNNQAWGEQISIRPDNSVEVFMTFLDLSESQARAVWYPLLSGLNGEPEDFSTDMQFMTMPFADLWSAAFWKSDNPDFISLDKRPGVPADHFWWATNQGEVSEFIITYQSRWLPIDLFQASKSDQLVATLFDASRHAAVGLHINKGLSGATPNALERSWDTSINPVVFDAAALVIVASRQTARYPGLSGHEPDLAAARQAVDKIDAAMKILREATPHSGAYMNEADYFEPDWQRSFYGVNYDRLSKIKTRYDPTNLFTVHHGIGSET